MTSPTLEYLCLPRRKTAPKPEIEQPLDQSIRLIPLTKGQVATVDASDYEWLNQWRWYAQWDRHTKSYYAMRGVWVDGRLCRVMMHRLILGLEIDDPRVPDHKHSGNSLDNRRSNLRISTILENSHNKRIKKNHSVGLKGVSVHGSKYRARIKVNGKLKILGDFTTPQLAHQAYCEAAGYYFGVFANSGQYPPGKFACWCGDSNCTDHP